MSKKKSGLTVALSGTVGSAINNAVTSAQGRRRESSDSRLKVPQATKIALSGVQAGQAAEPTTATGDPNATESACRSPPRNRNHNNILKVTQHPAVR